MTGSPLERQLSGHYNPSDREPLARGDRCSRWPGKGAGRGFNVAKQDTRPPAESTARASSLVHTVMTVLLFAAAFFVVQRLTSTLRFLPVGITTIWAPGALLFSALLLAPPRRWWVFFVGLCLGVFAAFYDDSVIPMATVMLAAQFHLGGVPLGVWGIRRFSANPLFGSPTLLLVFVANAIVLVRVLAPRRAPNNPMV